MWGKEYTLRKQHYLNQLNIPKPEELGQEQWETVYRGTRFGKDEDQALPREYQGFGKTRLSLWGRLRQRIRYMLMKV